MKGLLYGTATRGGDYGGGTVFSVDPKSGDETILHSLGNGTDGEFPYAGVIASKGVLYGTTVQGGEYGEGTVFAFDLKTGAETILHSFGNGVDGANPDASLIDVKGTLYGTTYLGGTSGAGTVFKINPETRSEAVVHSFADNGTDGANPLAALIAVRNLLYGMTSRGGEFAEGAAFSLDLKTDTESVIYSFCGAQNCADGAYPEAGLTYSKGKLYGTTEYGGTAGLGTVFSVSP